MKSKIALLSLYFVLSISSAFAHALWIETASTGKKGQPQEVKIFFGEYEENKPSSTQKWFSNLKQFKLVLTAPNGTTKVLNTLPELDFFKASFTPDQDGVYKLSIVHEVAAVYEHAKIEYYAFADVAVGKAPKSNNTYPINAILTIRPDQTVLKAGETSINLLVYNQAPLANQKITIVDSDRKPESVESDANGKFAFKPTKKGNYFLEAFTEDKTPGKLNDKDYEKVWHLVTYYTEVK